MSRLAGSLDAPGRLQEALDRAWRVRQAHFPNEITWSYPLDTAVLSLTGTACALDCAHCGRRYLAGMRPIWEATPDASTSCLISGGCDAAGRVPVTAHAERVRAWRQGRLMNWHVGLISEEEVRAIAPLADVVSFDWVGDEATIREVYGLERTVQDYVDTYLLLRRHVRTVPHVTIGLCGGELGHERPALERLEALPAGPGGIDGLVLLVFVPTPGTRYADRPPPPAEAAAEVIAEARLRFPKTPLYLGCMRPRGAYRERLDELAVRAGVNVVVSPARRARQVAGELGLGAHTTRECCIL